MTGAPPPEVQIWRGFQKKGLRILLGLQKIRWDSGGITKKSSKKLLGFYRDSEKSVIGLHGDSTNKLSGFHWDYRKFLQGCIRILQQVFRILKMINGIPKLWKVNILRFWEQKRGRCSQRRTYAQLAARKPGFSESYGCFLGSLQSPKLLSFSYQTHAFGARWCRAFTGPRREMKIG